MPAPGRAAVDCARNGQGTCDEPEAARLALARSGRPGPAHRPLRADDDGRLPRRGDGRPARRRSSCSSGRCRRAGRTWSSRGWSRRSATCSSWRSTPSRSRRSAAGRHFAASTRASWTSSPPRDSRATSGRCPRERSSSRARRCCGSTAPLPQAQWVETYLLASLAYPTLVASKAARIVAAAGGRPLFEFGARRGHGPHAGLLAARAAIIAGFAGTSHVEAARRLGIPAVGHHGPLVGPVVPDRGRSVRGVRPGLSRKHHAAGRHLRHARRRSTGRGDRAAGPGDPDRQRRSRRTGHGRLAPSSTSTAART